MKKNLDSIDEIIWSEKEKIELVNLDGFGIARVTLLSFQVLLHH